MSESHEPATSVLQVSARIDRIPRLTPLHRKLTVVLTALFLFDIVDLFAFGYAASAIREEWGLSIEQLGLLGSTVYIGMAIGGLVGGRLADRFGRRVLVLGAVAVFSVGSIASALSPNPEIFAVTRVVTGLGLTAATGAILVVVSELFPRRFRGRIMAMVLGVSLLGGPLVAFMSLTVVPLGAWRSVFVMGGGGLIIVLFAVRILPESPRWLAARGRWDEAEASTARFEDDFRRRYGIELPKPVEQEVGTAETKTSYLELFRPRIILRTFVATMVFSIYVLLTSAFGQWLPVLLIERGYPQTQALTFSLILSFGMAAGALLSYPIVDRFERKAVIAVCAAVTGIGFLLIGFVDAVPLLIVAGLITNIALAVATTAIFAYVPEIFPVAIRGTGAGVANGSGRFVGMFGPVIVTAIIVAASTVGVFVYLAALAALLGVFALLGPRTGSRYAPDLTSTADPAQPVESTAG